MSPKLTTLVGAVLVLSLVAAVVAWLSAFTVDEAESAIVRQFGDPVGQPITEPGLHWKLPFIQEVQRFDKRLLTWDGAPESITTVGQRNIAIDVTARWRIADPLAFLKSVQNNEAAALSRLDDIIDSVVRDVVASTELVEIVRSADWEVDESEIAEAEAVTEERQQEIQQETQVGREQLTRDILETAQAQTRSLGIELVDVRIKRLNYVERVQRNVFDRMISERQRIAEKFRSEGQEQAEVIRSEADRVAAEIVSQAERDAQIRRGEADAEATRTYNQAYTADPAFYAFSRTLESYSQSLGPDTVLLLSSDSPYLRYLRGSGVGEVDQAGGDGPTQAAGE